MPGQARERFAASRTSLVSRGAARLGTAAEATPRGARRMPRHTSAAAVRALLER